MLESTTQEGKPNGVFVVAERLCVALVGLRRKFGIFSKNLVPHPPLEDERRPLPTTGEAKNLSGFRCG
jgi:hypothetical protein